MIPTDHEIKNLHRSCAPNDDAFTLIYTHCLIVCDIVDQILSTKPELEIDRQIVRSGALLHDIGALGERTIGMNFHGAVSHLSDNFGEFSGPVFCFSENKSDT
jgi:hypothetical protein